MSSHTTTWPLIESTPDAPTTVPPSGPSASPAASGQFFPFGNGVLRPFQRDRKGDFANDSGKRLVVSALGQILGTRASSDFNQGELPWRPEFGSLIYLLKHRPNNATLDALAHTYVVQAIQRWEPRVKVTKTELGATEGDGDTTYRIRIFYDLVDTVTGAIIQESLETTIVL